ncbi:major capsid protein [Chromobacterium vaccinii]|uniref:major capsid protein n=1 Tax=Chromobacterium vaccinii TaxID=1108595 RepID=UPI0031D2D50A
MKFMNLKKFLPLVLSVAALPAFADGAGGIDVSSVTALIGTGVAAVALIGAAKMGVNGVIVLWNKVSSALGTR